MFIAVLKQDADGCDFSIECGTTVITLEAIDLEDATTELEAIVIEEYSSEDRLLSSATIYEVTQSITADVYVMYNNLREKTKKSERKLLYEKLKKEFEVEGDGDED